MEAESRARGGGHQLNAPLALSSARGRWVLAATVTGSGMAFLDGTAGVASGVNNTVARTAQLAAIAVVPVAAGITGGTYRDPEALGAGFLVAMLITAGLAIVGGLVALATIRRPAPYRAEATRPRRGHHCAIDGPPLEGCPRPDVIGRARPA